jgi:hypothetical protein
LLLAQSNPRASQAIPVHVNFLEAEFNRFATSENRERARSAVRTALGYFGNEIPPMRAIVVNVTPDFIETLPFEQGEVHVDTSVVRDNILYAFEPAGVNLQIQLRVRNLSSDVRLVAITKRTLKCGRGGDFEWVLGPGEAPVEIASGPTALKPKLAAVFSQRLRGSGESSECNAFFTIAEGRRPYSAPHVEQEEPPRWVPLKNLEVRLRPVVEAYYR